MLVNTEAMGTLSYILAAATIFGPSSSDSGNPHDHLACARRLYGEPRALSAETWAVATYALPCGTLVEVCAGGRCVRAPVLDRGPVRARPCLWRADPDDPKCTEPGYPMDLDLSYPVAAALGIADGRGKPTRACRSVRTHGRGRGCAVEWRVLPARRERVS